MGQSNYDSQETQNYSRKLSGNCGDHPDYPSPLGSDLGCLFQGSGNILGLGSTSGRGIKARA